MAEGLRDNLRLDSITCVIDAEQVFAAPSAGTRSASVYRCKGVIHTIEEPGRRIILQVVGKRVDIAAADTWNGRAPRTRLVAIGADDGMDEAALREVFDGCR